MKETKFLVIIGAFSLALLFIGLFSIPSRAQQAPQAQEIQPPNEVQIIKIRDVGYEGALRIEPSEVTIPVGMVVVWVNMSRKAEPQIVFAEGMKCALSTEASTDFRQDERKCFITDYVQVGEEVWDRFNGGFATLVAASTPVFWSLTFLTGIAVFVLRIRDRGIERPYSMTWFPLPAIIFCATCVFMFRASVSYAKWLSLVGVAPLAIGLIVWLLVRRTANTAIGNEQK